ncbi:hypothetical protein CEY11_06285 [Candidimonas nitroreducens]|uniref:Mandelate racemase/muconate lactonizing enzyme C-terminal domain-containing protein n=1 Tax=Candidimonas nitroreducens TaxID=683354 RepID=A0A225MSC3_9BURK|nr:hypothetical protein CEY11_06285 [Candidimonas nitroreducens]
MLSAFDQCCCDLTGQYLNRPIHHLWGNGSSRRLKAYATVNRSVLQRTPKGFAESCSAAVRAGFGGIKIMPFDAVTPQSASTAEGAAELKEAVRRLQAVRDAIGPEVSLMADCHWRLDVPRAMDLIDALADINLHWLECPVPESNERCRSVKDLRRHANRRGMLLAGGENVFSRDGAWPYITQGLYDVIMPDIKYCGGYSEFSAIAELASRHAVRVSPHNPSGPIAHAHTVQICAALGLEEAVEQQFAESHLFGTAVTGTAPRFIDGHFTVPTEPGLGLALDETVSSKHPYSHIPLSINDPSFAGSTGE